MIPAVLLVPLNWRLEAYKWKVQSSFLGDYPIKEIQDSVYAGITLGLLTPGRIGELAGRVIFLTKEQRTALFLLSFNGAFAQWLVLWNAGFPSLILVGLVNFHVIYLFPPLSLLLLVLYFSAGIWSKGFYRLLAKFRKKPFTEPLPFSSLQRANLIILSFGRTAVFSTQYMLLLWAFGADLEIESAIVAISCIFFLQAFSPVPGLLDLGVKGNVAIYVLQHFQVPIPIAILSAASLWMINLFLPSLYGYRLLTRRGLSSMLKFK
jgi:hypothetical protein